MSSGHASIAAIRPEVRTRRSTCTEGTRRRHADAKAIIATIQAHCETLSDHDKEGWLALWADDTVLEDPVGVDTYRGIEGCGRPSGSSSTISVR